MKGNEFNLKCWECGDEVPIKSIKFDTALTMVDNAPSTIIQAKNWKRGFKPKEKNPIEQELTRRGLNVIENVERSKENDVKKIIVCACGCDIRLLQFDNRRRVENISTDIMNAEHLQKNSYLERGRQIKWLCIS